jgi:hypothetical protein
MGIFSYPSSTTPSIPSKITPGHATPDQSPPCLNSRSLARVIQTTFPTARLTSAVEIVTLSLKILLFFPFRQVKDIPTADSADEEVA